MNLKIRTESKPSFLSAQLDLTEKEILRTDILKTLHNLDLSWANFMNAERDYIDVAIMEIYNNEIKIGILIRKLKIILGENVDFGNVHNTSREHFFWLHEHL